MTNTITGTIPNPGPRTATTMSQPITLGKYDNGTTISFDSLGRNTVMTGAIESGKTNLTHNYLDNLLSKTDNLTWIASTKKMNPLVLPWLRPWLTGRTSRPVIDRIAGTNLHEVLFLLDDFRHLATVLARRARFTERRVVTPNDPAISLVIDDADTLLESKDVRVNTFDGEKGVTASELLSDIYDIARTASMNVFLSTQGRVAEGCGSDGLKVIRNSAVRISGRTVSLTDSNGILTDSKDAVRATKLRDHTLLMDIAHETQGATLAKAFDLSDGTLISRHAEEYTDRRPTMPEDLAGLLGESYSRRWVPERQQDLFEACMALGISYPVNGAD